jgi:citrate/tricarballylate utilization protein
MNIPKLMAELRADTYRDFSWPAILSALFRRSGLAVALITAGSLIIILLLVLFFMGSEVLFATHVGEGAFYKVVPFTAMTVPPLIIVSYGFVVLLAGALRFWRETGGGLSELIDVRALWRATQDAFGLAYMKGGGAGCNYPNAAFSQSRRWLHHFVFYGFLLALASTTVAAFYHHFLHWQAPYPHLSWPVVLGTVGGIGLVIGTSGLLYLKWKSDRDPAAERRRLALAGSAL